MLEVGRRCGSVVRKRDLEFFYFIFACFEMVTTHSSSVVTLDNELNVF